MDFLKTRLSIFVFFLSLFSSGIGNTNESIRQNADMISFATGEPQRGFAVLTRKRDHLSLSISTMDLNPNSAYSVWWVIFNRPQNCLTPDLCNDTDVFESAENLNGEQVPSVQISTPFAAGFVTGSEGVATFTSELDDGTLPDGTFVDFGWSEPVGFGLDSNAGLTRGNGLNAEVHIVLRSHGDAIAGSVADQSTTFGGLCDVQTCTNVQAAIFRKPESRVAAQCIDTDGDGWGWDGSASCIP